jgi:hypothetical protein
MSERHLFVVLSNAVAGREDEFNDWYDNRHLDDVLAVPGVVSAQRFALSSEQRMAPPHPFQYLALYEIETDDLKKVIETLSQRSGTTVMPLSATMAEQKAVFMFKPITTVKR